MNVILKDTFIDFSGLKHAMGGQAISEDQEYDEKYRYVSFVNDWFPLEINCQQSVAKELQCSCPRTDQDEGTHGNLARVF